MLTLKVITKDIDGANQTSIFSGESITHTERVEKPSILQSLPTNARVVGNINSEGTQDFIASYVFIYEKGGFIKEFLLIVPKSDCFIMEDGKTVDTFYSHFNN